MDICKNCGLPLHESDVEGYSYVCFLCDENFYDFEANTCQDNFSTYVSFKHIDGEYSHQMLVKINGRLRPCGFDAINKEFEKAIEDTENMTNYDDDEDILCDILDSYNIDYYLI
jgi:hypothetical protein